MDSIRVLLASDFVLLRSGLRALLADCESVEVVGESAVDGQTAERVRELQPTLVILGVSSDDKNVFETIGKMGAPTTQVVVVSPIQDPGFVMRLLRAGVHGYLSNQEAPAELVRAMDAVARGEVFLCPSASKALLAEYKYQGRTK
jgi:two-component system, NarL family, response regulator NreC